MKTETYIKKLNEIIASEDRDNLVLRKKLAKALEKAILVVTFVKTDGTLREMECTLISDFIPAVVHDTKKRTKSYEVLPVFEMKSNEWRSFRLDSVKSVTAIEEPKENS